MVQCTELKTKFIFKIHIGHWFNTQILNGEKSLNYWMFSFLHHLQNQAWMTWELTESLTNKTFWVFAILTFGTKLMKWLSIKDTSPKDFLRVQIRYFIVFFAFQIPLTLQMPYGYFRYVDDGLGPKTIANVKIIYNMTAAFSGLFAGSFLSFFKHKFTIIPPI